ncbi:hypothetical protein EVJ58_g6635 [Rhodofomes roseus]|uniref:Uncharacterized protein n=1 Tax=Rhodofomes roseus TaxID=34475 RepID=A0A4Y9Y6E1_9APHY|nr:hypothetical protein EVJ58_g6635 [Rhodofomes roseus]
MFFAFTYDRKKPQPAPPTTAETLHERRQDAYPNGSMTSVFSLSQPSTNTHNSEHPVPSYAIAVDVLVLPQPERDREGQQETWIVDGQPPRPLARGQVVTLRATTHVIGAWHVSKVETLTRHWVTFRLSGGNTGLRIRTPIPWAHLCDFDGFSHTTLYHTLPNVPPPHHSFAHKSAFQNPHDNPYEFDITPGDEHRLWEQMTRHPRTKALLTSLQRNGEETEEGVTAE